MSSKEYTGWLVYERMFGPIGPERFDYLFAQLQATLANINRKKGAKAYRPDQFAPPWVDTKSWPWSTGKQGPQTGDEILRTVMAAHRAMGGRVGERKRGDDRGSPDQDRG